jgi:hypothetical protein
MNEIRDTSRDALTGYRVGRCGDWYVRVRRDGSSFDLMRPPFESWDDIASDSTGLTLGQAARVLGIPQGDLYRWGAQ